MKIGLSELNSAKYCTQLAQAPVVLQERLAYMFFLALIESAPGNEQLFL